LASGSSANQSRIGANSAGVGGRVGARRAADRRLVDVDDLVELASPSIRSCGAGASPALFSRRAAAL
jgi:methyl coenzyme M reductase subunit C-like uncharacterized protein (methanogenesis marker protein 7)